MARLYSFNVEDLATGTGTKTLVELGPASTVSAKLVSWWVEFEGTTATDAPIAVLLLRGTTGMSSATTVTAVPYDHQDNVAALSVCKQGDADSGNLGTTTTLEAHRIPPTSGIVIQYPLGREPHVKQSAFLGINTVSPSASVQATVGMVFEE